MKFLVLDLKIKNKIIFLKNILRGLFKLKFLGLDFKKFKLILNQFYLKFAL